MSTRDHDGNDVFGKVARGFNETFLRLVYLSPLALTVLLVFDGVRAYDFAAIVLGIALATVWTIVDARR